MERTLRDTLMTAERVMQETRENANQEGELIIQDAQMKAKGVLEECRMRTEELRREIVGLRKEKETYLARFHGLAEAQIRFVETHKTDFEDLDNRLVDIVDNVVSGATDRRTAATQRPAAPKAAAPAPVRSETYGPQVAPTLPAAPARGENDIWRDYKPGTGVPAVDEATTIAALVTESLAETNEFDLTAIDDEVEAEVTYEPLTIDVISNGQKEADPDHAWRPDPLTETVNT